MIGAIFSAIAALPKLLEFAERFIAWVSNQIEIAKKQKLIDDMAKAVELAHDQKDTSEIDHLFDPSKK